MPVDRIVTHLQWLAKLADAPVLVKPGLRAFRAYGRLRKELGHLASGVRKAGSE